MKDERTCPECGKKIPDDAPAGGLCPSCLLRAGADRASETIGVPAGAGGEQPTPAELAGRFPGLEVLESIGRGGMGAVYKARQVKLDRIVALKILNIPASAGPQFAERFTREARTLARVSHPNIVAVHDFGESDGLYFLVMEYVDGANLREIMRDGKLPPEEALALVPQICEALQFAHEEGIVHRDIKPENVLLDRRGCVKIADFGLAKLLQAERRGFTLTVPGEVMGTPTYMAPEQIEKPTHVDHRADIYSLGVVFYEMLTGELPLGRFGPPSAKATIDVRLDEVVLRTLEKEPERRYQHASDVKTDVESIGRHSPGAAPPAAAAADDREARATRGAGVSADPDGLRTVRVRRPAGVTWVAAWAIGGAVLPFVALPMTLLSSRMVGFSGAQSGRLLMAFHPMMWLQPIVPFHAVWLVWPFAVWGLITGLNLLRLKHWSRWSAIALALVGTLFFFPVGLLLSVVVLTYLLRRDVARVFELGEGSVRVPADEAQRLERLVG